MRTGIAPITPFEYAAVQWEGLNPGPSALRVLHVDAHQASKVLDFLCPAVG